MNIALLAAIFCLAAASPTVHQIRNVNNPNRVPGEFLVVLHVPEEVSNAKYASDVADKMAAISPEITIAGAYTSLRTPILYVKTADESVMNQLYQLDEVDFIEANLRQKMIAQCTQVITSDVYWGLSRVSSRDTPDYPSARHSYTTGSGNGVRVYVLDTGINVNHTDFEGRAIFGTNFADNNNRDNHGHGTHCAGTIAGHLAGVSKAATVIAVKVLDDAGQGNVNTVMAGLQWVKDDVLGSGARGVVSMSIGGDMHDALDTMVNDMVYFSQIPVITAAGNNKTSACLLSPGRAANAINVGATDINDRFASFSNWGPCVNVLAPGDNILSLYNLDNISQIRKSGTSTACPHISGLVANFLSFNPAATTAEVTAFVTGSATQDRIDFGGITETPNLLMYANCF